MPPVKKCTEDKRATPYQRKTRETPEVHYLDTTLAATAVPAAGLVNTNLVVIPQDDTTTGRNGRKVLIKSIEIRGNIVLTPAAAAVLGSDVVRIMVVQDRQANGAVFTTANVLATADWRSYPNLFNEERFRVLYDKSTTMNVSAGVVAATVETAEAFELEIKCKIPIEYDSSVATGAIASQRSNSIAVLMIAQTDLLSTVEYIARVRFTDL